MGLGYDVTLPKTKQPVFPERCIGCGADKPTGTIRVRSWLPGWWVLVFWQHPHFASVNAPACERCQERQRRLAWLRRAGSVVFIAVAIGLAFWLLVVVLEGKVTGPLALGIGVACGIPWILWEVFFPSPLDLTVDRNSVSFHFNQGEYAVEFLRLNSGGKEVVRDSPAKS